jgi:hypothetical protein
MARKSIAGKMVKTAARRSWTRFMDKVGSKFVAGIADTSSDAPDAHYKPKRDLYAQMQEEEAAAKAAEGETGDGA